MPQSLARVAVHLVYSTKNRTPFLKDAGIRDERYRYTATILQQYDCTPILINGVEDHVHLLFGLSRNWAIKKIVEEVKKEPSKWIKKKGAAYQDFHWQGGYGVFSVSESNIEQVKEYIAQQEERHKKITFQQEFCTLCKRHNIEIDERYVWD